MAHRNRRPNAVDAEWDVRAQESAWRASARPEAVLDALREALPAADLETARYVLWLALPVLRDADLASAAKITEAITDPDARVVALFLLLGRAGAAPAWWLDAARAGLAAIDGRTARNMEAILENVKKAVEEPARFELQEGLFAGARLFNAARYFDAHEIWEDVWRPQRGRERDFYRGLINLAVAMNKAAEGNANGVLRLVDRADGLLSSYGASHRGLDLAALRRDLAALRLQAEAWRAGTRNGIDPAAIPRLPEN